MHGPGWGSVIALKAVVMTCPFWWWLIKKLVDGPPAAGGWLRLLLPLGGTTLLLSAHCAAKGAAPSRKRADHPVCVCRRRYLGLPFSAPGCSFSVPRSFLMALQKPWRGRAALAAPGGFYISKSPKKTEAHSCECAFGFPLLSFKGLRRVARWALLVLASRFASTPY